MWRTGRDWLAGSVLVVVGLLLLAERRMPELVPVIPLVVGLAVLVLFLVRRSPTALLVGCVMTGAGIGVLLDREGSALAGVAFLGCLAGGFAAAWLLGLVFRMPGLRLWPLVGAVTCAGLAAILLLGDLGAEVRRVAVAWWPIAVMLLGVVLLAGARSGRRRQDPDEETRMVPTVEPPGEARW